MDGPAAQGFRVESDGGLPLPDVPNQGPSIGSHVVSHNRGRDKNATDGSMAK